MPETPTSAAEIVLGGPDPFPDETEGDCPAEVVTYWCTRDAGHPLPHVAFGGPAGVVAVWPPYRELTP